MGFRIKIEKIKNSEDQKFFYEVSTTDLLGSHFYFCIDQKNQQLLFFETKDFFHSIKTINLLCLEERIGELNNVPQALYVRVVMKVIKAAQEGLFPDNLDYCA